MEQVSTTHLEYKEVLGFYEDVVLFESGVVRLICNNFVVQLVLATTRQGNTVNIDSELVTAV